MQAWVFSDLHDDVNRQTPLALPVPEPGHDVVIIAGDICEGVARGVHWIAERGLNKAPVIYVPGNHEFYGSDFESARAAGRAEAAKHRNIHLLDRDAITIEGVRFLGATLWTDYRLYGEASAGSAMLRAERSMNDHAMIRHGRRLWRAADALAEHATSRSWLEHQLDRRSAGPVVVVTHTAPSLRSIAERYQDDLLSAAFASDLENFAARANLWVHGHTHIGCDYVLGDCRVVNNPRGYVDEGESERFDRSLVCTFGPV